MIASTLPDGNAALFPFAMPTPNRLLDVVELLNLSDPRGSCPRAGRPVHLRSIANSTRERVVRFACKAWFCPVCGPRLRRAAGEHYATLIVQSNGVLRCNMSEPCLWEADKKRMERRGVQWVRIGRLQEVGVVISCDRPPERGYVFSDRAGAIQFLGDTLRELHTPRNAIKSRSRPINASKGWTPGKQPQKFSRVGWVATADPLVVMGKLKTVGIDPASIKTRPGSGNKLWDCVFDCPPEKRGEVSQLLGH